MSGDEEKSEICRDNVWRILEIAKKGRLRWAGRVYAKFENPLLRVVLAPDWEKAVNEVERRGNYGRGSFG